MHHLTSHLSRKNCKGPKKARADHELFKCRVCDFRDRIYKRVELHEENMHNKCKYCIFRGSNRESLDTHLRVDHPEEICFIQSVRDAHEDKTRRVHRATTPTSAPTLTEPVISGASPAAAPTNSAPKKPSKKRTRPEEPEAAFPAVAAPAPAVAQGPVDDFSLLHLLAAIAPTPE